MRCPILRRAKRVSGAATAYVLVTCCRAHRIRESVSKSSHTPKTSILHKFVAAGRYRAAR